MGNPQLREMSSVSDLDEQVGTIAVSYAHEHVAPVVFIAHDLRRFSSPAMSSASAHEVSNRR